MRSPIIWREDIGVNNSIHQKMPHSYIEKLCRSKCPTTTKCINNLRNLYSKQKVGIVHIQLNICVPSCHPPTLNQCAKKLLHDIGHVQYQRSIAAVTTTNTLQIAHLVRLTHIGAQAKVKDKSSTSFQLLLPPVRRLSRLG